MLEATLAPDELVLMRGLKRIFFVMVLSHFRIFFKINYFHFYNRDLISFFIFSFLSSFKTFIIIRSINISSGIFEFIIK